jgi:hypothetical protein
MATTAKAATPELGDATKARPAECHRTARHPATVPASEEWDRRRMLPRLIPIGPDELADDSREGRLAILRRLAAALRGERVRGRAGHWSYSLDRHIGLVQALAAERRLATAIGVTAAAAGRPVATR